MLWKVIIAFLNREPPDPVDARVSAAQTQVLVRLMIGILWEAWRAVETYFLKSPLGREYRPLLDGPAAQALESLQKYFAEKMKSQFLEIRSPFTIRSRARLKPAFKMRPTAATSPTMNGRSISPKGF